MKKRLHDHEAFQRWLYQQQQAAKVRAMHHSRQIQYADDISYGRFS